MKITGERKKEGQRLSSSGHKEEVKVLKVGILDNDRYERSKRLGWYDIESISNSRVLVVGAGALGNEVVKNLVLSGFRHITLVDMDYVVTSNLNRCVFFRENDAEKKLLKAEIVATRARELASDLEITPIVKRIEEFDEDFIPSFDMVFGCLDNLAARLHLNVHCFYSKTPYIDGGTLGMVGKVMVVRNPGPCLECLSNRSHIEAMEKRFSCTGKDVDYVEPKLAAEITTTSVVAAVQVREGVKIASGLDDQVLKGMFYYDGLRNESTVLQVDINPQCPHHIEV